MPASDSQSSSFRGLEGKGVLLPELVRTEQLQHSIRHMEKLTPIRRRNLFSLLFKASARSNHLLIDEGIPGGIAEVLPAVPQAEDGFGPWVSEISPDYELPKQSGIPFGDQALDIAGVAIETGESVWNSPDTLEPVENYSKVEEGSISTTQNAKLKTPIPTLKKCAPKGKSNANLQEPLDSLAMANTTNTAVRLESLCPILDADPWVEP